MSAPERFPRTAFTEGNWSFRPVSRPQSGFAGFEFYPKGERSHWARRGDMTVASDGKTWMFTVYKGSSGRRDARPTFAEAKAEILRILNDVKGGAA